MTIDRRQFVGGTLTLAGFAVSGCSLDFPQVAVPELGPGNRFEAMLRQIEGKTNGTLGAEFVDVASGQSVGINRNMRFGHCSSFKLSLAAMILQRNASGEDNADRRVMWSEDDLMFVSPFTTRRLSEGATLRELAEATQKYSDNAAANILLREIGGPAALTAFWRSLGDDVSRLDRIEPALNNVPPTEIRDTTTPAAMARTVAKLAYGDALPEGEQATLRQWMVDTPTGLDRVRQGLPEEWRAGDKTGTGLAPGTGGIYIDIGFVEPPTRGALAYATYYRPAGTDNSYDKAHEEPLAQIGQVLGAFVESFEKV
ncbi:class A beta-lactamase [uncultured Erythrobacter sp.]|uniref:class A beta-lactamase n=1 Tax=uncultured Erythrobacter sp. TaxID=263913 RepID=UPI002623F766|nr:class A beta-lactamase [uncultured Erythrobacter sp.]